MGARFSYFVFKSSHQLLTNAYGAGGKTATGMALSLRHSVWMLCQEHFGLPGPPSMHSFYGTGVAELVRTPRQSVH
eukprot:3605145-Amphidinium_carterae.1